jgi:beta-lactamase class A
MRRGTRPIYVLTTLFGVVLFVSATTLIRQPRLVDSWPLGFRNTPSELKLPSLAVEATQTFPPGSRVAGVDVGGRTPQEAAERVHEAFGVWQAPLPLAPDTTIVSPDTPTLDLEALHSAPPVPQLIEHAAKQYANGDAVNVPWQPQIDAEQLRAALREVAPRFTTTPSDGMQITPGDPPRVTFVAQTSQALDVEATAMLLEDLVRAPQNAVTRTVVLRAVPQPRSFTDLQVALRQQSAQWDGVVGIAVHDLKTGERFGINDHTVFSGASVLKVPILVYAYAKLGALSAEQGSWADAMIEESDNEAANALLAAGAGGYGPEAALQGVEEMSAMLAALGLEETYLLAPYATGDAATYNVAYKEPSMPDVAPGRTAADEFAHATPGDMAQFFSLLAQCAGGEGPLLAYWGGALTPQACSEIVDLMAQPHDTERMVAGIPGDVRVAHKGGWLLDMQADVGIVYSPNRTYVAAIYMWRDGLVSDEDASPSPYLGALSHTIYSFYNPE